MKIGGSLLHAYGICVKGTLWKVRCLLPMEKGDRGAVDKGYPGMREGGKEENSVS